MANRYWIFRAGVWDTTNTVNWSTVPGFSFTGSCTGTTLTVLGGGPPISVGFSVRTTAGVLVGTVTGGTYPTYTVTPGGTYAPQTMDAGAQGGAVPTLADSVFFQSTASFTVTATGALNCLDLTVSAGVHTFVNGTAPTLSIYGSMTLVSGTVWTTTTSKTFRATSTGKTITTNGVLLNGATTFNGVGGGWTLGSALTGTSITWRAGAFDDGGYSVASPAFSSTFSATRSLNITATWLVTGSGGWQFGSVTGLSITGNGTISFTGTAAKAFINGGLSYAGITLNQGGSGELTISGATTLFNITNTVQPTTVIFPETFTTTVSNFSLTGTAGSLVTIRTATAGSAATLSKASGTVAVSYLSIQDSTATGGASWNASNSTNVSGNTGWNFGALYAAFLLETASSADDASTLLEFIASLSELSTATDTIDVAASVLNAPVSELATVTDTTSAVAAFLASLVEFGTATETVAALKVMLATVEETATGTDSISGASATNVFFRDALEAVTATDSVGAVFIALTYLIEAATGTDLTQANTVNQSAVANTTAATDAAITLVTVLGTLSEATTATDTAAGYLACLAAITESITAADAALGNVVLTASFADTATTTDGSLCGVAIYAVLNETATATDVSAVVASIFSTNLVEVATGTDTPTGNGVFNASVLVVLTISDTIIGAYLWNPIDDTQTANWQNVSTVQSPGWTTLDTTQIPGWVKVNT